MSDSPVTRGKFLRSFASSLPGLALGTGIASAAQALAHRVALLTDETVAPARVKPALAPGELPLKIPFLKSGPTEGNRIALTFDDGPTPGVTDHILDELKQRGLHATFFMIGERVAAAPDLARRVLAEGHEIGNHSFTHPKLTELPESKVAWELQRTQEIFEELLKTKASWFRPPYGAFHQNQAGLLRGLGLGVCLWNVDPGDWAQPGEDEITETVLSQTQSGSIIVCHDKYAQTANSVGQIADRLVERGFHFETISSLLA